MSTSYIIKEKNMKDASDFESRFVREKRETIIGIQLILALKKLILKRE